MKGFGFPALFLSLLHLSTTLWAATPRSAFPADMIEPGKTQSAELQALLGRPRRMVRENHREIYIYDMGVGSNLDATVSMRAGVVESVTYLCNEKMAEVKNRFASEPASMRSIHSTANGLAQVLFESRGRGYVYDPKSYRARVCVAWQPGKKFDELGR